MGSKVNAIYYSLGKKKKKTLNATVHKMALNFIFWLINWYHSSFTKKLFMVAFLLSCKPNFIQLLIFIKILLLLCKVSHGISCIFGGRGNSLKVRSWCLSPYCWFIGTIIVKNTMKVNRCPTCLKFNSAGSRSTIFFLL